MIDVFGSLKSVLSRSKKTVNIDNSVFKLHYRFTATILIAFCLLVSAFQYIGDPIDCVGYSENLPGLQDAVEDFCWMQNTFIIPEALEKEVGVEVPAKGIDRYIRGKSNRLYQTYYQWVGFVLFLQAMFFYLPHYFWKIAEAGRMKALALDLQGVTIMESSREKSINVLVDYYRRYQNRHQVYMISYFIFEIINFLNVVIQIFVTDQFLGGEFLNYGINFVKYGAQDTGFIDYKAKIFPKVAKCIFYYGGAGAELRSQDVLCVLPLNIVNEKLYIFLWFWFIILAIVSGLEIVYRILTLTVRSVRYRVLKFRIRLLPVEYLDRVFNKAQVGDWFVLYQLSKNIDEYSLRDFFVKIAMEGKLNDETEFA